MRGVTIFLAAFTSLYTRHSTCPTRCNVHVTDETQPLQTHPFETQICYSQPSAPLHCDETLWFCVLQSCTAPLILIAMFSAHCAGKLLLDSNVGAYCLLPHFLYQPSVSTPRNVFPRTSKRRMKSSAHRFRGLAIKDDLYHSSSASRP
jgi:hypothetical protein